MVKDDQLSSVLPYIPCECGTTGRTYELHIYLEPVRGWVAARGILSLSTDITFSSTSLPVNTHTHVMQTLHQHTTHTSHLSNMMGHT